MASKELRIIPSGLARGPSDAEAVAAAWLLGHREPTRSAYERDLRRFGAWLRGRGVEPLGARRVDVDAYRHHLEDEGLKRATVARALAAISGYYTYAVGEGVIGRSPCVNVKRPVADDESPTLGLDRVELTRLIREAERKPRDLALVLLLGLNGLRISEALGGDVSDLGHQRGHRTLTITRKGGRRAVVPLAPRTSRALDRYLDGRTAGPLFVTRTGKVLDARAANRTLASLARRARLDKTISAHSLRHSFVTLALDAGVALRDVQDAAGHRDPRTTRRYDRGRYSLDRHPTYRIASEL